VGKKDLEAVNAAVRGGLESAEKPFWLYGRFLKMKMVDNFLSEEHAPTGEERARTVACKGAERGNDHTDIAFPAALNALFCFPNV